LIIEAVVNKTRFAIRVPLEEDSLVMMQMCVRDIYYCKITPSPAFCLHVGFTDIQEKPTAHSRGVDPGSSCGDMYAEKHR
jgi:hypothetical protein